MSVIFALKAIKSLNKSFAKKIKMIVLSFNYKQPIYCPRKYSILSEYKSRVKEDILLFRFENPKFFFIINCSSIVQCGFWTYTAYFFIQALENPDFTSGNKLFWGSLMDKNLLYIKILASCPMIFGWAVLFATGAYSVRSVRKIILHKGGNHLTIKTYNIPGFNTYKVPLGHISSYESRTKVKRFIPVKLKNNYFYYIVDTSGEFPNPDLFDITIGVKRAF